MATAIPYSQVQIQGGFWQTKQKMVRDVTVHSVYDRFVETFRFEALKCQWTPEETRYIPHVFWDSDVVKWMEGVAYLLQQAPDAALEQRMEEAIATILSNCDENGYFNSHFLVMDRERRFADRNLHELYCAGHLIEAAVAYYESTGRDAFLKAACRYADYIERVFKTEQSAAFVTPGHPELELALVKLYRCTGENRYLELSKFFLDQHGCSQKDIDNWSEHLNWVEICYNQDEMPLRNRTTADGHCVRALYLLCAMADVGQLYDDQGLLDACRRVFENITQKRMYITGGVGSSHLGEAFTVDYHLPNRTAYAETCAAISLALFAGRMQNIEPRAIYADTFERAVYNGILSGISMAGNAFFYENPLEIDPKFNLVDVSVKNRAHYPITQRVEVFDCSCCPPNLVRFLPSVTGFFYGEDENTVFVHHYAQSEAAFGDTRILQHTDYPADGSITLEIDSPRSAAALRIPGWCRSFTLDAPYTLRDGYAYVALNGKTVLHLNLDMPVTAVAANPQVHDNAGRVAVTRGPIVYCAEGVDNGEDLAAVAIDPKGCFALGDREFLLPSISTAGYRPPKTDALYAPADDALEEIPLRLIPYYAFANRGTTEMRIWLLKK